MMFTNAMRRMLWMLVVAALPTCLYASCPNNCTNQGCPMAGCDNPDYCGYANGESQCWFTVDTDQQFCQECQYHFSCGFDACENWAETVFHLEYRGCLSGQTFNTGTCYDHADLNTGYDCCP